MGKCMYAEKLKESSLVEVHRRIIKKTGDKRLVKQVQTIFERAFDAGSDRFIEEKRKEEKRMEVTDQEVLGYLGGLVAHITGVAGPFVFNMDEIGHPCHVSSVCTCLLLTSQIRQASGLPCVATDGNYLRPDLVIPRQNFEDELVTFGLSERKSRFTNRTNLSCIYVCPPNQYQIFSQNELPL
jgi:hypothetical protein